MIVKGNLKIGLNNKILKTAAFRNEAGATLNIIGDVSISSDTSSGNVFTGSIIENEGNMTINGRVVCSLQPDYFQQIHHTLPAIMLLATKVILHLMHGKLILMAILSILAVHRQISIYHMY